MSIINDLNYCTSCRGMLNKEDDSDKAVGEKRWSCPLVGVVVGLIDGSPCTCMGICINRF